MTRVFGSLLCWFMPDKVMEEVTSEDRLPADMGSLFIATALVSFGGWRLVGTVKGLPQGEGNLIAELFIGPLGPFIANMVIIAVFTWAMGQTLSSNKVTAGGKPVQPEFGDLFPAHLHAWAVMMMLILLGAVTRLPLMLVLMAVAIVRTADIEARLLRNLYTISLMEAYRIVLFVFGIMAAGIAVAAVFIKFTG